MMCCGNLFSLSICNVLKCRTGLAISQDSPEVKIFKFSGNKWQNPVTLSEHGQRVTGIDWAPNSNRIVTCGAVSNGPSHK